jgi:TPP-dependent pyruvate/acetoin dehydrogenase alpha subunit
MALPVTSPGVDAAAALPRHVLLDLHRRMVRIRVFEETAGSLMDSGRLPGFLHLYVGQEAVAAGVMAHLGDADQITSTHRGHGHLIAKGGDLNLMMAELFGKATGYCKGKGGSLHISNLEIGVLGANGIVAGGMPIAVGAAYANRYRDNGLVTACFFGDGASNEGAFHEALNMAALYQVPLVFVCENNGYGEWTAQSRHQRITDIADRAAGYGLPGVVVDGQDAVAVYTAAGDAVARARAGGGPTLLEAKTYRFYDHVGKAGLGFEDIVRPVEERAAWKARCPIALLERRLAELGVLSPDGAAAVHEETDREVDEAVRFSEASPLPDVATLTDDVYCESPAQGA